MSDAVPAITDLPRELDVVGVFSRGILRTPGIAIMLGARSLRLRPADADAKQLSAVLGWGAKANSRQAEAYAQRHGLPFLRLEDGFLRSVGLGVRGDPPLSIVIDDQGIYYDATRPSRLERLLDTFDTRSP